MLNVLGLGKPGDVVPETPRPVCAVSKIMVRDGLERGQKMRVKVGSLACGVCALF
jgi:hypothetical protein